MSVINEEYGVNTSCHPSPEEDVLNLERSKIHQSKKSKRSHVVYSSSEELDLLTSGLPRVHLILM